MLLKLCSWLVSGIAILYVLEFTGIVKEREYFPSLPRLEANAADPSRWFEAAHWGITHGASWVRCASQDGGLTSGCPTEATETATAPEPAAGPANQLQPVVAEPAPEFDPATNPVLQRMEQEVKAHPPINGPVANAS